MKDTGSGGESLVWPATVASGSRSFSIELLPNPVLPHPEIGEGSGVISTNGPTPGEEIAEAGERESDLRVLEPRTDRILDLRTGSPALKTVGCDDSEVPLSFADVAWSPRFFCSSK